MADCANVICIDASVWCLSVLLCLEYNYHVQLASMDHS